MALLSFKDWLLAQESSPLTRSRDAAAKGLGPPIADYNSRSTPDPWTRKNAQAEFDSTHKKHRKKGTSHKPRGLISVGPTGKVNKKKATPHADDRIDSFLNSVDNLETDWKKLQDILDKKAKVKPTVDKPKPDLDKKKPNDIGVKKKPDEEGEDRLDEPEEEEEDEGQPKQPPFRTKPRDKNATFGKEQDGLRGRNSR